MGDKISARIKMIEAGVPVVPGTQENLKSVEEAVELCNKIGYPVMLKASMGGGGKGCALSTAQKKWKRPIQPPKANLFSSFGDDTVYLEKFVEEPHHIEFQILGDKHGNVIHLANANVPCNAAIRRLWKKLLQFSSLPELRKDMGESGGCRQSRQLYRCGNDRVFGRQAPQLLLPRNEYPPARGTPHYGRSNRCRPRKKSRLR